MNKHQRNKNRQNAEKLARGARHARLMAHTCENCGEPGGHWAGFPRNLDEIVAGEPDQGFWTCSKYYGEDGKRLPEHTERKWSEPADALGIAALIFSGALATENDA